MMTSSGMFMRSAVAEALPPERTHGLDANATATSPKLTPEEQKAIGDVLGAVVKGVADQFAPKAPPPPPPPTPTMIKGVPDMVVIGAFALVLVVVFVKV